jgi:hypothetical protein
MNERLSDLLVCGQSPKEPLLRPNFNALGQVMLEDEEAVVSSGEFPVSIQIYTFGAWKRCLPMRTKGNVVLTDQRLVFFWPRWKSDAGLGSLVERRLHGAIVERDAGARLVLGGHIRHQWVKEVYFTKPTDRRRPRSNLRVDVQDGDDPFTVQLTALEPQHAQTAACQFAEATARMRLAGRKELTPEIAKSLEQIAGRQGQPVDCGWGFRFQLGGAMKVGFDYPA